MAKIVIDLQCEERTCGKCVLSTDYSIVQKDKYIWCALFEKKIEYYFGNAHGAMRLPECLAAEVQK